MKYVIKKHFWGELPFDAIHYQSCYSNSQLKTFAFCLCSPCFHFFFVVDIKVSANARFLQSLCTLHNPIGTRGSSIATSCRKDRTGPSVRVWRDRVVHHVTGAMNYMSPLLVQNFISQSLCDLCKILITMATFRCISILTPGLKEFWIGLKAVF